MRITNNLQSLQNNNKMNLLEIQKEKQEKKITSGKKINGASDDAAGLAIAIKLASQYKGLNVASRNAQDGSSLLQTADGALNSSQSIIDRMKELAVQGSNGIYTDSDRQAINAEMSELTEQLNSIAENTEFNGKNLLDGSSSDITLQIGANSGQTVTVGLSNMSSVALSLSDINFSPGISSDEMAKIIDKIDAAKELVSSERGKIGAYQNRLQHTYNNNINAAINTNNSRSKIEDTDMALTIMEHSKNKLLKKSSISMMAQSNQSPYRVLKLI